MHRLEMPLAWLLRSTCLVLAGLHLSITLSTLLSSSLIHPLHDQFRLNLRYLTEPFPLSVLLLENGHRPVLPGIARVVELYWLGGWPWIQLITAWGLAAACTTLLLRDMRRAWSVELFLAGAALTVLLLWWNAHARMFIHVYEAVHLFYILGGMMASLCIAHAAARRGWPAWWHFSWVACVAAAFSFGPGIATFAALLAAAWMLGAPIRVLGTICVAGCITTWLYVFVLPGADGVRNASGQFAAGPFAFHLLARLGAPAHDLLRAFGIPAAATSAAACLAGMAVLAVLGGWVADTMRRQRPMPRVVTLGAGLMVFGVCANLLIAVNRTSYFLDFPDQLFADRYLFWACMGWLGAAICLLHRRVSQDRAAQLATAAIAGLVSVSALPVAVALSGWSAEVYRHVERTAVGMQVNAASPSQIGAIADAGVLVAARAVDRMRERHLAGYHPEPHRRLTPKFAEPDHQLPMIALRSSPDQRQFSAQLEKTLARKLRREWLWLVDAGGTPLGLAAPTHSISGPQNPLRIGMPALDGLEGYWIGPPAEAAWLGIRHGQSLNVVARVRADTLNQAKLP